MPLTLGIGAGAASLLGGIFGNASASSDRAQALALQQQALKNIMAVNDPSLAQLKISLQSYANAGQLAPEMQQTISQNPSLMGNIQVDPQLRQAQMQALGSLQQQGKIGLRPQDLAALNQIQNQQNQAEQANQQSIIQNMQQRGVGGGGAELAARLSGAQNSANMGQQAGLNIAGQSQMAALQALMNSGQLGSQMETQQFGESAQKAAAQDAINRYNTMNQQQVQAANVGSRNQAQAANLANAQSLSNANTQLGNQQNMYNAQLPQQVYQNQLNRAGMAAGTSNQTYNALQNQGNLNANMWNSIGSGVGQGAAAIGAYGQNQANMTNQNANSQADRDMWARIYGKQQPASTGSTTVDPNLSSAGLS